MAAITWTGAAGDGNFNNPANWSPAQVPGANDTVTISPKAATLINISTADAVETLKTSATVTLSINDGSSLTVGNSATKNAAFTNAGTIELNNNNYTTSLIVGGPEVTLSGGGTILMGTGGGNQITGAAAGDVLNNTGNLIEGAGQLGAASLTYINGAGGTVDATDGNQLVINTGTNTVSNAGLLEATAGGGLVIESSVANGAAGKISAAGANVYLASGADIAGGTLTSTGASEIAVSNTATLDGTTNALTNLGTVAIQDNSTLTLLGSIVNSGQIVLEHNNYNTDLVIGPGGTKPGTVTLSGSGTIVLGDNGSGNRIYGAIAGDTLINMGNTISGAGQLGTGTLTLINDATINANGGNALYLNTGATATNNSLIEATGSGGLYIQSGVDSSGGGTILAANANVILNGGTLAGGLVTSTGTGGVYVQTSGTLDGSAHTLTNTGLVYVEDNSALSILGTIANDGTISLNAFNYNSDLLAAGATVTLTGGGSVLLDNDTGGNLITAAAAGDGLVNVNNLIQGAGEFGDGTLTFTNDAHGIVDANLGAQMVVNTGSVAITNMGLMEATAGGGGMLIQTAINSSGGGTILGAGGNVILNGGTLIGGLVTSTGTGGVYVQGSGTLDGTTQTVTNSGLIYVEDNAALSVLGVITNTGTISLNAFNYNSDILIGSAAVTLTGGGTILLDSDSANLITASTAGNALVNLNNTIEGAAQLGYGTLTFTNAASGIVDANNGGQLVINTGTVAVTNMGLLEATAGSGGLVIQSNISNGTTGHIAAAGGNVFLQSGADIIGGTLSSSGTGSILDSNSATLGTAGGTITSTGTVALQDNTTLTLLGTILNDKLLASNAFDYNTDIIIGPVTGKAATVTLSGGGTLSLSDAGGNRIYGGEAGDKLVNQNNTISGAGSIGVGGGGNALLLTNNGTIAASTGGTLTLNTGAVVTNNKLIEATGGSNLYIDSVVNSSGGGTILAASGDVLLNGGTLQGGLVNSAAGFAVVDINNATLDGSTQTVTNAGVVSLNDGTTLTLLGTITNQGTIALNNNDYNTDLVIGAATVTLTGGGTVALDNGTGNRIYGAAGTDVLVNVDNTITGGGQIGAGQMILINDAKGVIDASQGAPLTLTESAGGTITNAGLLESTGSGGLIVQTVINDTTGGTILANGGNVYLNSSGTVQGGVFTTGSNGGSFDVNGAFTLDGTAQTLTNNTLISVNDGQTLTLLGTITNHGTIALNNNDYYTDLIAGAATVTLSGGGTILMDNGSGNRIYGAVGTDTLINVNNLIEGGGQIGAGQLTLINQAAGVIDANDATGITINTGSAVTTNAGLIEATGTGGLSIQSIIDSSSGGTILAAGGNVYLDGGTLRGGLIKSSGGGAFVVNGGATLDGSAHTLTSMALVNVDDGQTLTLLGAIANSGTIAINNGDYNTDVIIGSPTVSLTGTGTIQLNNGGARLYGATAADVLDNVSNLIEGTGQLGAGQLTLINAGTINANGASALTISLGSTGLNSATGTMLASGAGGLSVQNGTYTNQGLYEATDGSALTFSASATLTNDSASGTLTGGTYTAVDGGNGATVSITGAAVTTLDAGIVLSGAHSTVEFGGVAIDTSLSTIGTAGALSVLNDRYFQVTANGGTLTDNGTITLSNATFADTELVIGSKGVFSGNGTLVGAVSNSGTIDVVGGKLVFEGPVSGNGKIITGAGGIVDLTGGGTITQPVTGSGTLELGGGSFTLAGSNITIANLVVDAKTSLTGTGTVTSQTVDTGTITAMGGTLSLTGPVSGTGTLAADANSVLIVGGGSMFGGTIAGPGTVDLVGPTTLLAGIDLTAAAIMQSSTVTLASGVSVTNLAGNTYTLASATKNDETPHRAQIQIDGGQGDVFTNAGSLVANSSALIAVDFANTGTLTDTNGTLTVSGSLTGMGGIALAHRAQLALTGGGDYAGAFTGAGTLSFDSAFTLDAGASLGVNDIIDTDLLTLASGESVRIGGGNVFALADAAPHMPHRAQVEVKGGGGSGFTNVGTVTSSALAGTFDIKFANGGLTTATAGTLSFLGAVSNTGTFDASGGAISIAKLVTGNGGALEIGAASTLSLLGGAAAGQTADFLTTTGALDLGMPLSFAGTIDGFGGSDVIDLLKTASTSETFAAGVLTVQDNGATVASLHFAGSYTTSDFMLTSDNNGGTNITFV